jgi:glycosyltransferase involved in cell wall biosynthesis
MKVLYVYSGERARKFRGKYGVDYPDTQFYGMNHLEKYGIDAQYREFESNKFGKIMAKLIGFRMKHLFMFFVARKYDIVFGISVIYMLLWKKVFPCKTKFIIFNSALNRMLNVHKVGTLKFRILLWILWSVDGIVFLSNAHLKSVTNRIPFLVDRCYFVPMGVDRIYYKPKFYNRKKYFLSVGRDNARDYKTIVDVARMMPDEEFHLVCLPRNIKHIDVVPANVKIHINIPKIELEQLYLNARALLLIMHNDTYVEGSDSSGPTVLLESMAMGLPVVVSHKSYIDDYLVDREDSMIVDFYDVAGIINCIRELDDDLMRTNLAINARKKIDNIFNTDKMASELSKVFKKIYE